MHNLGYSDYDVFLENDEGSRVYRCKKRGVAWCCKHLRHFSFLNIPDGGGGGSGAK